MRLTLRIQLLILLSATFICGQQISRPQKLQELRTLKSKVEQMQNQLDELQERQGKITEDISSVSESDKNEAEKISAKAVRLFPDGTADDALSLPDGDSASVYAFSEIANYYFAPRIEYKNGALEFSKQESSNVGYIINLGGTLPQIIDERNPAFGAIVKYEPPNDPKDARSEFTSNDLTFKSKAAATAGNTYLARVIAYDQSDEIYALKIHRRDTDGSIILFIKQLKTFEPPKLKNGSETARQTNQNSDQTPNFAASQAVQSALLQKGFYQVSVEASSNGIILRGTVPKGKLAEAVQLAQETGKRPIRNELTEQ